MKKVFALHTGPVLVEVMRRLFDELLPSVRLVNIVDDGLLNDVRSAGGVSPQLARRLVSYGLTAEAAGADAILNCCSSVGEAAETLASLVSVPVVRIDRAMADAAVNCGTRIAVLATLETTLDPTERLIQRRAAELGRSVVTTRFLANSAFDALLRGDTAHHDEILRSELDRACSGNDVVVLAQGSMARLLDGVPSGPVPVLSSPRSGVQSVREALRL